MQDKKSPNKVLIVFILVFALISQLYAEEHISAKIGDEYVEFVVPDDPIKLREYYKAIINAYVQSENSNVSMISILKEYGSIVYEMRGTVDELKLNLDSAVTAKEEYLKLANMHRIYFGPIAGYSIGINPASHILTLGVGTTYVTPSHAFYMQLPLQFQVPTLNFTIGLSFSYQYRIR